MKINLPQTVEFIINKIYEKGYEAFIVGGCVRDSILGISPNDYDITTDASPKQILSIFNGYKMIKIGIKHGTIGVVIDNEVYEITTYRIEGEYEDNRRPKEVKFTKSIIEDLKRRDFTINSMAYNNREGLIDKFNGVNDLRNKLIKTVGESDERFNEDGLRIIRAIRFSGQLGFEIEENTLRSIYRNAILIKNISKERITDEVNKLILSDNAEKIELLYKTKIFKYLGIYDGFTRQQYNCLSENLYLLNKCSKNIEQRVLMLEYLIAIREIINIDKPEKNIKYYKEYIMPNNIVNKLKYSTRVSNYCNNLIEYMFINDDVMNEVKIKKILKNIGFENLKTILNLKKIYYMSMYKQFNQKKYFNDRCILIDEYINKINNVEKNKECYTIKGLEIDGKEIKKLGYTGIEIGEKLNYLLEEVIKNPILNNKKDLMDMLK